MGNSIFWIHWTVNTICHHSYFVSDATITSPAFLLFVFSDIHLLNRYLLSTYYILSTDFCLFIVYSFYAFFFPVFCLLFKKSICSLLSQSESFILEQEDLNYLCLLLIVSWVKLLLSAYFVFWIYAPFVFLCFLYFTL